jgi:hypothetical protein
MMRWSFQNYIMLKSSRKKLIAIGCSFTEHYLSSITTPDFDYNFPRWPQHLADKLDMECVNLGQCGSGNKQILSKIINTVLTEKNIGIVVVMWSQFQRLDFEYSSTEWMQINLDLDIDQTKIDWDYKQKNFKELHNPHSAIQDALRTFILAEKLLKDIPHLYIQGPDAVSFYSTKKLLTDDNYRESKQKRVDTGTFLYPTFIIKLFFLSSYFDYVEKNLSEKFIGWPIMQELGGYSVTNILDKLDPERTQLRISKEDIHPNAEGHKIIAQEIYNAYEKVYI